MPYKIPPVDITQLKRDLQFLRDHKVKYGLGAKAPDKFFLNPNLTLSGITAIDCSGFYRLALYRATEGKLLLPDGSWNQREWCEQKAKEGVMHQVKSYQDINRYMREGRLFVCFIKPWSNGCAGVGHVWLTSEIDGDPAADTLESHGGTGPTSRDWDAKTLVAQFYSGFELPTV